LEKKRRIIDAFQIKKCKGRRDGSQADWLVVKQNALTKSWKRKRVDDIGKFMEKDSVRNGEGFL